MKKLCRKCNIEYDYTTEFFFKDNARKSGLSCYCKSCKGKSAKIWDANNKDKRKLYDKKKIEKLKERNPNFYKDRYIRNRKLVSRNPMYPTLPEQKLAILLRGAKKRAKLKGRDFDITQDFLMNLWNNQDGKCILTNIKFDLYTSNTKCYSPSLDRIDSSKGYTKDNVRLIIHAMNMGLSNWGTDIFDKICINYYNINLKNKKHV